MADVLNSRVLLLLQWDAALGRLFKPRALALTFRSAANTQL